MTLYIAMKKGITLSRQRQMGDQHVKDVASACKEKIHNRSIKHYSEITVKTVEYIMLTFPHIAQIKSKFEFNRPDLHPDLIIEDKDGSTHYLDLFLVKGNKKIQPKNLGAKSFFRKYFLSSQLQERFNEYLEDEYALFLKRVSAINKASEYEIKELKKLVKEKYPRFDKEIEPFRQTFLFNLREFSFYLLKEEYKADVAKTKHAFDTLLLKNSRNIITRYTEENKCLLVEEYSSKADLKAELHLYKKGQNSIGIRAGEEALILRFKFESGPTSSIKLATSYERFTSEKNIVSENVRLVREFTRIMDDHVELKQKNKSNAIGKVNEAAIYYEFVKQHPKIYQIDSNEGIRIFKEYSQYVNKQELNEIINAARQTVKEIMNYVRKKYVDYKIDSIQLVPESYIKNRLDTSDMKVIMKKGLDYIEETFSLKALARKSFRFTSKNVGAGTILGKDFFDLVDLKEFLDDIKNNFLEGKYTHRNCLEKVSEKIGIELDKAPPKNLKKGLQALLGNSTLVITFYKVDQCLVLEHERISSKIHVQKQTPTPIQTTLYWGSGEEMLLRVKFSASQKKGWSSLKLACDYKIKAM